MAMELQRFGPDHLFLTQDDAFSVIRFFWRDASVSPGVLTDEDRQFAQGLLLEAIDASYAMGYVEIIFRTFFGKVAPTFKDLRSMVKSFCKKALKHWFKHATQQDLADPKIYESVRVTLANRFRSVWKIRESTGELVY